MMGYTTIWNKGHTLPYIIRIGGGDLESSCGSGVRCQGSDRPKRPTNNNESKKEEKKISTNSKLYGWRLWGWREGKILPLACMRYKGSWNKQLRIQLRRMLCSSSSSNDPTPAIIQFSASAVAVATAAAAADGISSYGRLIGSDSSSNGIRLPLTTSYLHHHHDLFVHQAGPNYISTQEQNYVQDQSIHSSYSSAAAGLVHQQQSQENSALAAINIMRNNNYSWELEHQTSASIVSELQNHPHVVGRNKLLTLQTNAPPASSNEQRYI